MNDALPEDAEIGIAFKTLRVVALRELTAMAQIARRIALDPVEAPGLVQFVNEADPAWVALVEASKTVNAPQGQNPPQETAQAAAPLSNPSAAPESSPQGTPAPATAEIDPFEPAPGQKFKFWPMGEPDTIPALICFHCPKCSQRLDLPLRVEGGLEKNAWLWDRNLAAPTLAPSIVHKTCGWHGFIRGGEFQTLPDSGPMPGDPPAAPPAPAPAMVQAPIVDTPPGHQATNETNRPQIETSLRPHVRKMAGN